MPPCRRCWHCFVLVLLLLTCWVGCGSWEETKSTYVEGVNEFLHRRYARDHASGDWSRIEALYATSLREDSQWLARKQAWLGEFGSVRRGLAIIEDIEPWRAGKPSSARLRVQLVGENSAGEPYMREDFLDVEYDRVGDDWKIFEEKIVKTRRTEGSAARFRDEAVLRGVRNVAHIDGVPDKQGRPQPYPAGSGVAVGDIDDDGWDDLYFSNGEGGRLLRNVGGGRFEDVTERTGTGAEAPGKTRCALLADFIGDDRVDIFVGRLYGPNMLYRQNGDGTFTDIAESAGLLPTWDTTGACAADFNQDGHLDLYVINGFNLSHRTPEPMHNALNAVPNVLFMNNGDGTFRDVSKEAGVDHTGFALSCTATDYDGDGDSDLFIANDFGFDVLYRNRGDGTFEDVTRDSGLTARRASMSGSWGDVDGDGFPELFVSAMTSNSRWMVDQPGYPVPASWPLNVLLKPWILPIVKEMLSGNRFYKNNGDGSFSLAAIETENTGWGWSAAFLDFDNDSVLDLYATNGFVSGEDREDL